MVRSVRLSRGEARVALVRCCGLRSCSPQYRCVWRRSASVEELDPPGFEGVLGPHYLQPVLFDQLLEKL